MDSSNFSSPKALTACSKNSSFVMSTVYQKAEVWVSFIPQRLNRAQDGGTIGGIESENQTGSDCRTETDTDPENGDTRRQKRGDRSDDHGNGAARKNSEHPAEGSQYHRLKQELHHDVALSRPDRFSHTDLARAFGHGDQHDIHNPNTANDQGN